MPITAPDTRSVPRQFQQVKPKSPDFIQRLIDARIEARMAVMKDHGVNDGAARLYMFLDDYAGLKGYEWTGTRTLATALNVHERIIFSRLKNLEEAGHIIRVRGKYRSKYRLAWAPGTADFSSSTKRHSRTADFVPQELLILAKTDPASITEPVLEPAVCSRCGGTGKRPYVDRKWDGSVVTKVVKCSCS